MNSFTKNLNLKKKIIFFFFGGGGGVDGRRDERAQTNFFPFNFFEAGGIARNYVQVMALTSSIFDHFII